MWCKKVKFQYSSPSERKTNPLHWGVVFFLTAGCLAWMLVDTTPPSKYVHSKKYQSSAIKSLNLDDAYRLRMQRVSTLMSEYCERGLDVVFAHNVEIDGKILNDHVFHECGGKTWLNARVVSTSSERVKCQEEYANVYKTRVQPRQISMRAVSVDTWTEQEVEGESTHACRWLHAIDILENKWL